MERVHQGIMSNVDQLKAAKKLNGYLKWKREGILKNV